MAKHVGGGGGGGGGVAQYADTFNRFKYHLRVLGKLPLCSTTECTVFPRINAGSKLSLLKAGVTNII